MHMVTKLCNTITHDHSTVLFVDIGGVGGIDNLINCLPAHGARLITTLYTIVHGFECSGSRH